MLLLVGVERGRAWTRPWTAAAVSAVALVVVCCAAMPGALAFLTFQRDRGTEVESLGALAFQVARHFGWEGSVLLNYGSVEFVGPYVPLVSGVALGLTALALGWLLVWRLRVREFTAGSLGDAAFTAVALFTATSRVISPQYMLWLVGLAAAAPDSAGEPDGPAGGAGTGGDGGDPAGIPAAVRPGGGRGSRGRRTAGRAQRSAGRRVPDLSLSAVCGGRRSSEPPARRAASSRWPPTAASRWRQIPRATAR